MTSPPVPHASDDSIPTASSHRPHLRARTRQLAFPLTLLGFMLVLCGLPWWQLVASGGWPTPVFVAGTVLFAAAWLGLPALLFLGHGPRQNDRAAVVGDVLLGSLWVLFSWTLLGQLLRLVLVVAEVPEPARSRGVTAVVLVIALGMLAYGHAAARRVPRIRSVDVILPRLGPGLDGLRLALITDTHFGPLDRTAWSEKVAAEVNKLDADMVCHAGDLADGAVVRRRRQVDPLGRIRARLGKYYITGNHEYYGEADGWLRHMRELGWTPLHNEHAVLERNGDRLVIAGIDDPTGAQLAGHGPDLAAALAGVPEELPIVLLAHQPKQVKQAAEAGVGLQLSGHTHGGQIWPFHYLVRIEQPVVSGLSRFGDTQLYTSRGTGFWGPPLRIFAPSEITCVTLRTR